MIRTWYDCKLLSQGGRGVTGILGRGHRRPNLDLPVPRHPVAERREMRAFWLRAVACVAGRSDLQTAVLKFDHLVVGVPTVEVVQMHSW